MVAGAGIRAPLSVPAIDTHVHFYDPTRPQGVPWPAPSNTQLYQRHLPERLRPVLAPHRVVGVVVVEASAWLEDNQWLLDLAANEDMIVGIVGRLSPGQPGFAAQLDRFSVHTLFCGIRLRGADIREIGPGALLDDLRLLAARGRAVDLLGKGDMLRDVAALARRLPELRLVVDHLPFGEFDDNLAALRAAWAPLAALPRVYVKVSAVARRIDGRVITDPAYYRASLDVIFDLFGPKRVIYASNWPVSELVAPYDVVHSIVADYFGARGRAVAEDFFWRNSHAAYRWQGRGAAAALQP